MGRSLPRGGATGGNVVITGRGPPRSSKRRPTWTTSSGTSSHEPDLCVQATYPIRNTSGRFRADRKEFGRIDVLYNNAGVSGPVVFGSAYEEGISTSTGGGQRHLTDRGWRRSRRPGSWRTAGRRTIVMVEPSTARASPPRPARLPGVCRTPPRQSAKLASDYLAWALAGKAITVLSSTRRRSPRSGSSGSRRLRQGSKARARIGRTVSPNAGEGHPRPDGGHAFVDPGISPRSRSRSSRPFGGRSRSPPRWRRHLRTAARRLPSRRAFAVPDLSQGRAVVGTALSGDVPDRASAAALARSRRSVVLSGAVRRSSSAALRSTRAEGRNATFPVNLSTPRRCRTVRQPARDRPPPVTHGSVDWKRRENLRTDEWTARVTVFG